MPNSVFLLPLMLGPRCGIPDFRWATTMEPQTCEPARYLLSVELGASVLFLALLPLRLFSLHNATAKGSPVWQGRMKLVGQRLILCGGRDWSFGSVVLANETQSVCGSCIVERLSRQGDRCCITRSGHNMASSDIDQFIPWRHGVDLAFCVRTQAVNQTI